MCILNDFSQKEQNQLVSTHQEQNVDWENGSMLRSDIGLKAIKFYSFPPPPPAPLSIVFLHHHQHHHISIVFLHQHHQHHHYISATVGLLTRIIDWLTEPETTQLTHQGLRLQ